MQSQLIKEFEHRGGLPAGLAAPYAEAVVRACCLSEFTHRQLLSGNVSQDDIAAVLSSCWNLAALTSAQVRQWSEINDEAEFNRLVRQFRNRAQALIILRDVNRIADLNDTVANVSMLADMLIIAVRDWHADRLSIKYGMPRDHTGQPIALDIIAMGKLGARELNLSSDIDLIFAYSEAGTTDGENGIDHQVFFSRLGQRIIRSLDQRTPDGFAYRVDMRLRPYGGSGALVSTYDALETYYQSQGRDWERYAMVKARVLDKPEGCTLEVFLKQFCYRRYVDFSVIDSLRDLKKMIDKENQRLTRSNNIKLGQGGIREIEFIAQSFQVVRGGRDSALQDRGTLVILNRLQQQGWLSDTGGRDLTSAYVFLRNLEHLLQAWRDEQTQTLPSDQDSLLRLAIGMGYETVHEFEAALALHRAQVHLQFEEAVENSEPKRVARLHLGPHWAEMWADFNHPQWLDNGFIKSTAILEQLIQSRAFQTLNDLASRRLDELMPRLLAACAAQAEPDLALERVMPLIHTVLRRSVYLSLLLEQPQALGEWVRLAYLSRWIAQEIVRYPALLDELVNSQLLYAAANRSDLANELRQLLMRVPEEDIEEQMDILRYFRRAHILRIIASEVTGRLPLIKVSDYLSHVAEVVLDEVVGIAWEQVVEKYGVPVVDGEPIDRSRFVVLAYGKLGGFELGHQSDLDLVFIYDAPMDAVTNGSKEIDATTFYARMGQRIIHILSMETASGRLYETDMRLRPSGNSGPLVSRLVAFKKYQYNSAWVWEHQALVRARVVAGDGELGRAVSDLRREILAVETDSEMIRNEVRDMRIKMREAKLSGQTDGFHLKHDKGGIVDIEFMVQYLVLIWGTRYPPILRYTDNLRIIDACAVAGVLDKQQANSLIHIYKAYREAVHEAALQQIKPIINKDRFIAERALVCQLWDALIENN